MCYLCKPSPGMARTQRVINAALRVWRRKQCSPACAAQCAATRSRMDWSKPPTRQKVWTARDFDAYQRRTRYNPLPGR